MNNLMTKLSSISDLFSLREEKAQEIIKDWELKNNYKVLYAAKSKTVYLEKGFSDELIEAKKFFDNLICHDIKSHLLQPGREYNQAYVYFLLDGEDIVYIGQTVNLLGRLNEHRRDKDFNQAAATQVHKSLLDLAEQANITHYYPRLNSAIWKPKSILKNILKLINL